MRYLIALAFIFASCDVAEPEDLPPPVTTYRVKYEVTGTAKSASLTYENATGGTEQRTVQVPWSTSFSAKEGQFLYLSAQNEGQTGEVTTTIYLNNNIFKRATSSGAFVIASVSGSARCTVC